MSQKDRKKGKMYIDIVHILTFYYWFCILLLVLFVHMRKVMMVRSPGKGEGGITK